MVAYKIADGRYPIFSPIGAALVGGRWNSAGRRVIYAAEAYSAAILEILVHINRPMPPKGYMFVQIEIPDRVSVEKVDVDGLDGWGDEDMKVSRAFGDKWYDENRSAILLVPSVVTQGPERNIIINVEHRGFQYIVAGLPQPVQWDERLFRSSTASRPG